jgi:hypothetical protein
LKIFPYSFTLQAHQSIKKVFLPNETRKYNAIYQGINTECTGEVTGKEIERSEVISVKRFHYVKGVQRTDFVNIFLTEATKMFLSRMNHKNDLWCSGKYYWLVPNL